MKTFAYLTSAATALLLGSAAIAAPLPYTASVTSGSANNALSLLSDGVIPPDYTAWNSSFDVWLTDTSTTITFDFGGLVKVSSMLGTFDNNDDYVFTFYNGATPVAQTAALSADGFVTVAAGGVETFEGSNSGDVHYYAPFDFSGSPILATSVVFSAGPNTDSLLGIGEVQFNGTTAPEPASWAMMVGGFGLIGGAMRRRQRSALSFG